MENNGEQQDHAQEMARLRKINATLKMEIQRELRLLEAEKKLLDQIRADVAKKNSMKNKKN